MLFFDFVVCSCGKIHYHACVVFAQELGLSFYAVKSRHGAARNGVRLRGATAAPVHRVQSLGALPACRRLLGEAIQHLGLKKALLHAEGHCNGLVRRYARGQALPRHVDNPMFEER